MGLILGLVVLIDQEIELKECLYLNFHLKRVNFFEKIINLSEFIEECRNEEEYE